MCYVPGHHLRGRRGPRANRWRGGVWRHKDGYIYLYRPDHPDAVMDGYVAEHRLVAEKMLGRRLTSEAHIHHINWRKDDNRPENLAVLSRSEHARIHPALYLTARSAEDLRAQRRAAGRAGAAKRWGKSTS